MSLLTVIRRANAMVGLRRPTAAVTAPDATATAQMTELARIEAESLANRHDWSGIVMHWSFNTVGNQNQVSALPDDFARFTFNGGIYGDQGRIWGPIGKADWSQMQAFPTMTGLYGSFRMYGGTLQMTPTPAGGMSFNFDYVTKEIYRDANNAPKSEWSADTDTCLIPENLIALGVIWRWLQAKGLDYGEAMRNAEIEFEKLAGTDGAGRRTITSSSRRFRDVGYAYPGALGPR